MDKPQIIAHVQKSMNYTLFDCRWVPCSAKFVVLGNHARGTGALQIYEMSHGDISLIHEVDTALEQYTDPISVCGGPFAFIAYIGHIICSGSGCGPQNRGCFTRNRYASGIIHMPGCLAKCHTYRQSCRHSFVFVANVLKMSFMLAAVETCTLRKNVYRVCSHCSVCTWVM